MRKRTISCVLAFIMAFVLVFSVSAEGYKTGEVLYHQDFSAVSATVMTGIQKGTASSTESVLEMGEGTLRLVSNDDLRTYLLLPEMAWTESYTIEFDFRFSDVQSRRGYLAFLLTCWGEEPSNITALVIRANGTMDDFGPLSDKIVRKLQDGTEMIHVEIPIENGILHEVTLSAGNDVCTVQRTSLKRITEGGRGFSIRRLTAEISEVYVVNGTGYTAKTGTFANASWSDDPANVPVGEAPPTGDPVWMLGCTAGLAGIMVWIKRPKKHH